MSKFWLAVKRYLGKLGLAGVGAMLVGGAIRVIEQILPLTGYQITQTQARILFWLSIGVLFGGAIAIVIAVVKRTPQKPKEKLRVDSKEASELEQIPNTLTLMHHRIKQLREELAKRDIGREKAIRLQEKMHEIIPVTAGIRKRIQRWRDSGQTAKFIKGVELVNKLAIGGVYGSGYENNICDLGGVLETEDVGLKPLLNLDREGEGYASLKTRLEMQCASAPTSITKPILKYERYLYGLSSVFVWNVFRIRYLGKGLPTVVEAKITQYQPDAEDEILSKLKEDVIQAIDEYIG